MASAAVQGISDARDEAASLFFDPADERPFTDIISEDGFFVHPLSPGSEAHYRFRSGDVTTLRLADGTTVRLRELQILPRRKDSRLFQGSLWLDDATAAPVRTVFRLARPFDLALDANRPAARQRGRRR